MTCSDVRGHLPAFLYGDLAEAERHRVQEHLTDCAACRHESEALRQVRELLDTVPAPSVQLDPWRIQQEALARQEQRLRRWRRTAWVALTGLAASLLLVLLPSLELRFEGQQCTLRWGAPLAAAPPVPAPPAVSLAELRDLNERLRMLQELTNVLAEGLSQGDHRDRQRQAELLTVRTQMAALQGWVRLQLAENERNLTAVYHLSRKGENR